MRIIAGSARGIRLAAPEGRQTRPVLDRVKESWFAVLGPRLDGARALDLYAGIGSLGLEALSRGAASCVFVESSRECVSRLRGHLDAARLAGRAEVLARPVEAALAGLAASGARFDIIFVDPPFALVPDAALASAASLLDEHDGLMMLRREAARRGAASPVPEPAGLPLADRRVWGRSEVLFWDRAASAAPAAGGGPEGTA